MLSELELLCRKLAILEFAKLKLSGLLFINVSPMTMALKSHPHGETINFIKQAGLSPQQIVIEVTERFEAQDNDLLQSSLEHYRQFGFKIAIDDLGTGHSGLKQWAELRPDIVKIDRFFISGSPTNIVKRELLRTIFELGRATDVEIIAEGIETNEEYLMLKNLGMKFAQGYLLGRPSAEPERTMPESLVKHKPKVDNVLEGLYNEFEISRLVQSVESLHQHTQCLNVYRQFKADKTINLLVVINEQNEPIGQVYRDQLAELFSSDYGHALYDKRPVSEVMDKVPLTVDVSSSIDSVSSYITDNEHFDHRPEFVVVNNGKYVGIANVRSLLKKMTEEKIKHAQHANPLTMLPGNVVIQQKIKHLLTHKKPFQMAYFDLDNFKPFNDLYGYAAGDEVIKLVAEILKEFCSDNFIGHVGGDDFVVVFPNLNAEQISSVVLQVFSDRIENYLEPEHIQAGGYHSISRDGVESFFPLIKLSCGVITPDVNAIHSPHDIAQLASVAKKKAKLQVEGNVFLLTA